MAGKKSKEQVIDEVGTDETLVINTEKEASFVNVKKVVEKDSVTVTWRGNTRTYTRKIHGADFLELAKEFAEKNRGELV